MTDQERNVRTLIVCFVIAFMVMIPLRFVEAGQQMGMYAEVLGDRVERVELPRADVAKPRGCIEKAVVDSEVDKLLREMEDPNLAREQVQIKIVKINELSANKCQ